MKNENGQALIKVLFFAVLIGFIAKGLHSYISFQAKQRRKMRVLSSMSQLATKARVLLSDPNSFDCSTDPCDSATGLKVGVKNELEALNLRVAGSVCDPNATTYCGITPKSTGGSNIENLGATLKMEFVYTGEDVSLAPIVVQFPKLTPSFSGNTNLICPETTPVFQGLNASGSPICIAIPLNMKRCPAGEYVSGVYVENATGILRVNCRQISTTPIRCADNNQYVERISNWGSDLSASPQCKAKVGL